MKSWNFAKHAAAVVLLLSVAACGGGGDSPSSGGTGGTGVSFGTITDFGSVITNNRRLDDSTASVTLDDNPGSGPNGGLKKGMVVKVSGTFTGNTGTASTIQFRDNVEGRVCDLITANGITTMRVLGQTVLMDATTIIDNNQTIIVGDIVEVSGLPDDQERIHASFVEKKVLAAALVEVKGRIDTVVNATSFKIKNLVVNHAGAVIDNNIPGGTPAVNQFVEVKGTDAGTTCDSPAAGTDSLTATRVELEVEGAGGAADGNLAEVEGFVTVALNANQFSIGKQQVIVSGSTRYLPEDFNSSDIVVGAKLEAEGTVSGGVLNASKVSFRHNVKMESDVTNLTGLGQVLTFNLVGVPGITLTTNSATDFRDPVVSGDQMEVRGIEGPNNTVLVTRVRLRSNNSDAFLQGPVDSISGSTVTVLGVAVDTASINIFEDVNDVPIDRGTFLSRVQRGTLVKFKGTLGGATITWNEAELED